MKRTLDVYLHHQLTGHLTQDEHGQLGFEYAANWLDSGGAPLSHSLPLRRGAFTRNECRGFFAGILPEESKRATIARNLGISGQNDFALLECIGGECAGAITFVTSGQDLSTSEDVYRRLNDAELAKILRDLPRRPLMAGEEGIRLSLAGAQDKIAVHVAAGLISVPLGGAPSTHILKPAIAHFEGLVFNEALCMRLAQAVGLNVANIRTGKAQDIDYLLVERYDRRRSASDALQRLHQEDFCQALNIVPEQKYQNEGGPSLQHCFDLVREISTSAVLDLQSLLDSVIYNNLIGNHDAHGKNFSLLYSEQSTRLAPLYDLLSTVYYPVLAKKMAMKIGGEYASDKVLPLHFEKLAVEARFAKPLVKQRVPEIAESVLTKLDEATPVHPVSTSVAELIKKRCQSALTKFRK